MKRDPRQAEDFTQMLFHLHKGVAEALPNYLDLSKRRAVLDVGGGSGVMSIALAKKYPHLRACILDIATDWSRPSGMVQSRISDTRVIQYWDNDHLVAKELRQQLASEPSCCQRKGTLWDLAALYGKQVQWGNTSPIFADGTVVDAVPTLRKQLAALSDGLEH